MFRTRSCERRPRDAAAPERPRLGDAVALLEPQDGAARSSWLVTLDEVPVARVPARTAGVLRLLDGERSLDDVRRLAPEEPAVAELEALVARLRASGLLADRPPRRSRAVRVIPPLTVQFATTRLTPLFALVADRLRPALARPPLRRAALVVLVAVLAAGAGSAVAQGPVLAAVATGPLALGSLVAVALALVLATAVHELAHGVVLHLAGGTARRTGLMLFYLTPAFFVDVTDGWRLPGRRHRVAVALAGPAVHALAASLALMLGLALAEGPARDAVLAFALAAVGITAVNLLPVVRFDGYYALVAATDTPHLRERAREALDALLTGTPGDRRPWVLVLGAGSLLAPVVLVLLAYGRIARWSTSAGFVGAVLVLGLGGLLTVVAARECARWLRRPLARRRRAALLGLAIVAVASTALLVPVPQTATVGVVTVGDRVWLVSAEDAVLDALPTGAPVELETQGVLLHATVGEGTVGAPDPSGPTSAPLESLAPVRVAGTTVPVVSRPLRSGAGDPPASGAAVVRTGEDRPALLAALDPLLRLVGDTAARAEPPTDPHEESR